jgi:Flp pilus assembly protein TadD
MKTLRPLFLLTTCLVFTGCSDTVKNFIDPDKTFASMAQPDVKGMNDTQEQMAKEALASGNLARASQFYELLVMSGKGTKEQQLRYKLGFADVTRRLGDNEHALAMFNQLLRDDPNNLDAAEGKGLTLMAMGKSVEASRVFSDIVDKDATRWRTLNALGILFVTKDMIPEAMAYYNEALKHSPDNPAVLNNMGLSQAVDHKYDRALDALDQASRFSKSPGQSKQIDLNIALVYGVSGDLDHARQIASKYFEGPALDNNMGLYAYLSKNDGLAKTYLNMALSQDPMFYQRAWNNLDLVKDAPGGASTNGPASPPSTPLPKIDTK